MSVTASQIVAALRQAQHDRYEAGGLIEVSIGDETYKYAGPAELENVKTARLDCGESPTLIVIAGIGALEVLCVRFRSDDCVWWTRTEFSRT